MTPIFKELLTELGKILGLPLHVDKHQACSIQISPQLTLLLQPDSSEEHLFLFSKLIEIPAGKFRENVLLETLKANSSPDPRPAIFGYMAATNQLALYQKYPLALLHGDSLAGLISAFLDFWMLWRKTIESGQTTPPSNPLQQRRFK